MPIVAVLVVFMVAVVAANIVLMPRFLVLVPAVSMPALLEPVVVGIDAVFPTGSIVLSTLVVAFPRFLKNIIQLGLVVVCPTFLLCLLVPTVPLPNHLLELRLRLSQFFEGMLRSQEGAALEVVVFEGRTGRGVLGGENHPIVVYGFDEGSQHSTIDRKYKNQHHSLTLQCQSRIQYLRKGSMRTPDTLRDVSGFNRRGLPWYTQNYSN